MALRVVDVDLLGDALLELGEDLLDVDLLVRRAEALAPARRRCGDPAVERAERLGDVERSVLDLAAVAAAGERARPRAARDVPRSCASSSASRSSSRGLFGSRASCSSRMVARVVEEAARREELRLLERGLELGGGLSVPSDRRRLRMVRRFGPRPAPGRHGVGLSAPAPHRAGSSAAGPRRTGRRCPRCPSRLGRDVAAQCACSVRSTGSASPPRD